MRKRVERGRVGEIPPMDQARNVLLDRRLDEVESSLHCAAPQQVFAHAVFQREVEILDTPQRISRIDRPLHHGEHTLDLNGTGVWRVQLRTPQATSMKGTPVTPSSSSGPRAK